MSEQTKPVDGYDECACGHIALEHRDRVGRCFECGCRGFLDKRDALLGLPYIKRESPKETMRRLARLGVD